MLNSYTPLSLKSRGSYGILRLGGGGGGGEKFQSLALTRRACFIMSLLGGLGACPPRKYRCSEIDSETFWTYFIFINRRISLEFSYLHVL